MPVIKTIDVVGVSGESWRDAALQALAEARRRVVRLHLRGKPAAGLDKLAQLVRGLVKKA